MFPEAVHERPPGAGGAWSDIEATTLAVGERWLPLDPARSHLLLVREGMVLAASREYSLRLPQGALLVTDPREPLRLRRAGGEPAVLLDVARPCEVSAPGRGDLAGGLLQQLHDPDCEVARALHRLCAQKQDGAPHAAAADPFDCVARAQQPMQALIERCGGRTPERRREQYLRLARARAVLAWGEGEALDVARVAEIARLSTNYFVMLFRRVFGLSPHQYRIERRMELARRLIAHTRLPIRAILPQLGLDSHSTFTRAFRLHFGLSATAWREHAAAAESSPG